MEPVYDTFKNTLKTVSDNNPFNNFTLPSVDISALENSFKKFGESSLKEINNYIQPKNPIKIKLYSTSNATPDISEQFSISPLVNFSKAQLISILELSYLPKIIVFSQDTIDPTSIIISINELKEKGLRCSFSLDSNIPKVKNHHYIYIFRSSMKNIQDVVKHFPKDKKEDELNFFQKKVQDVKLFFTCSNEDMEDNSLHTIAYISDESTVTMNQILERDLIFHRFNRIQNIAMNIFPLSNNVLSMEFPRTQRILKSDMNYSYRLKNLAQAILQLEQVYGIIPNILCFNDSKDSLFVKKYLKENQDTYESNEKQNLPRTFKRLILIDRNEDLITPCLTQMTYAGLIDEMIGIDCNIINIEKKHISKSEKTNKFFHIANNELGTVKHRIHLNDEIYTQLKDVNICAINKVFNDIVLKHNNFNKLLELHTAELDKRGNLNIDKIEIKPLILDMNEKTLKIETIEIKKKKTPEDEFIEQELKKKSATEIVDEIKILKKARDQNENLITKHQNIASYLVQIYNSPEFQQILVIEQNLIHQHAQKETLEFIKELIKNRAPIHRILRLFSLYQQVFGHKNSNTYARLRDSIVETYGLNYQAHLINLETANMLKNSNFYEKNKKYHLVDENIKFEEIDQSSIAYTYGRYAPLSGRFIEELLALPLNKPSDGFELVCFVGEGCTQAELSAIRLISQKTLQKIVVLTPRIITGNSLMDSFSTI